MVNVWDVEANDLFLAVLLRKSFGDFCSLKVFHYKNHISPFDLAFINWSFIEQACRFYFKLFVEQLFCCFASVLVLIADEKRFHFDDVVFTANKCCGGN